MAPKSIFASLLVLLPLILLLAPSAYGCAQVTIAHTKGHKDSKHLTGKLYDNSGNVSVCDLSSMPKEGTTTYSFKCAGKAGPTESSFDAGTGVVHYSTDHGNFVFGTTKFEKMWQACVYGCTDAMCFTKAGTGKPIAPSPVHPPTAAPAPSPK